MFTCHKLISSLILAAIIFTPQTLKQIAIVIELRGFYSIWTTPFVTWSGFPFCKIRIHLEYHHCLAYATDNVYTFFQRKRAFQVAD